MVEIKEIRVEEHLRGRVKSSGGEVRKLMFPSHNGAPDRLVGWAGYGHALIELKRPKGPGAEDHQKREHRRLRLIGFRVYTMHTKEEISMFVEEASAVKEGASQRETARTILQVHDLANAVGLTVQPLRDEITARLGCGGVSLAKLTAKEARLVDEWLADPAERDLLVTAAKTRA